MKYVIITHSLHSTIIQTHIHIHTIGRDSGKFFSSTQQGDFSEDIAQSRLCTAKVDLITSRASNSKMKQHQALAYLFFFLHTPFLPLLCSFPAALSMGAVLALVFGLKAGVRAAAAVVAAALPWCGSLLNTATPPVSPALPTSTKRHHYTPPPPPPAVNMASSIAIHLVRHLLATLFVEGRELLVALCNRAYAEIALWVDTFLAPHPPPATPIYQPLATDSYWCTAPTADLPPPLYHRSSRRSFINYVDHSTPRHNSFTDSPAHPRLSRPLCLPPPLLPTPTRYTYMYTTEPTHTTVHAYTTTTHNNTPTTNNTATNKNNTAAKSNIATTTTTDKGGSSYASDSSYFSSAFVLLRTQTRCFPGPATDAHEALCSPPLLYRCGKAALPTTTSTSQPQGSYYYADCRDGTRRPSPF
eukprot:GHVS01042578.1.p1 GENE.GHVS01042578.1~~GHVS01042578.1.p1  ORF type:complete len:414 (-),score=85.12 GHVS01042578.1:784-2025(-)